MKPALYIDVDGGLFGEYGDPPAFQLRPGVTSFLMWAAERFDCRWLTAWSEIEVRVLMAHLYANKHLAANAPQYVDWWSMNPQRNTTGIDRLRDWWWLDDAPAKSELRDLIACGERDRWIPVNPKGADELERVKAELVRRSGVRA